jgi:hypothetical protein
MVIAVDTKPLRPTHTIQAAASVFAFVVILATKARFRVATESLTVTVGRRILREGTLEIRDSVSIYAKEDQDGNLVVEVLVFNPDWDGPFE